MRTVRPGTSRLNPNRVLTEPYLAAAAEVDLLRGTYRCLISGDIVVDPDLITSWRITLPAEPGGAARWEPNYAPHFQSGVPEEWEFDYRHDPDFLKRLLAERGQAVVGQPLLAQLRRYEERDDETQYVGQEQLYGRIVRVSYAEGIVVQLADGHEYRLPPDLSLLQPAPPGERPLDICRAARDEAASRGLTPLILDTAGRLHIDETMLDELKAIRAEVKPHHVLLVVDAMTGQDAVTVAEKFNAAVGIDAIILTKMDGDSRGGAALSVRQVTGRPIAFVGVGEKTDALEPFHPDRVASRILGMGDVLSLVEKAQEAVDQKTAEEMVRKLRTDSFTLDDFRQQLSQLRSMGPLDQIMGMLPFGKMLKGAPKELDAESADLGRFDAIILSMTPQERRHPEIVNGSRRQRIARGSGTTVQDVNRLLKQYAQLRKMMKQFKGLEGRLPKMKLPGLPG